MHATGWSRGLDVTGGGTGVVSHAGLALLRQLSDRTGHHHTQTRPAEREGNPGARGTPPTRPAPTVIPRAQNPRPETCQPARRRQPSTPVKGQG